MVERRGAREKRAPTTIDMHRDGSATIRFGDARCACGCGEGNHAVAQMVGDQCLCGSCIGWRPIGALTP